MHRRNFLSSGLALGSALSLPDSVPGEPQGKTEKADPVIDAHGHAGHGEALERSLEHILMVTFGTKR